MSNLKPRIIKLKEKKLIGKRLTMSLANNRTVALWKSFAPRIKEINGDKQVDKISLQVYDKSFLNGNFNPNTEFEKWAAIAVDNYENIPKDLEKFVLKPGLYAVFDYKGSSADPSFFQYIYTTWLPNSIYKLDDRPHFEVLGEKYKNNHPDSEEEFWIPIQEK